MPPQEKAREETMLWGCAGLLISAISFIAGASLTAAIVALFAG